VGTRLEVVNRVGDADSCLQLSSFVIKEFRLFIGDGVFSASGDEFRFRNLEAITAKELEKILVEISSNFF